MCVGLGIELTCGYGVLVGVGVESWLVSMGCGYGVLVDAYGVLDGVCMQCWRVGKDCWSLWVWSVGL